MNGKRSISVGGMRAWARQLALLLILPLALLLGDGPAAIAAEAHLQLGSEEGLLVFQPAQLTIRAGDTVRVTVGGLGPHNLIVAGHPEWSHEPLSFSLGDSWEQTFPSPGHYTIWCEPHRAAGMTGSITVLEAGSDPAASA